MQDELEGMLASMKEVYGGTQYAAVHGRVEDDFVAHCHALSGGHPKTAIQALVSNPDSFNGYTKGTAMRHDCGT